MTTKIKLILKGFQVFEQRIIDTTARLSKGRTPELALLSEDALEEASVIIVDGNDADALVWASQASMSLMDKTVVWVDMDSPHRSDKHTRMNRPIIWVNLPIIITRILEEQSLKEVEKEQGFPPQPKKPQVVPRKKIKTKGNILVVDDSDAVRGYLQRILIENHYKVATAEDGEVAIEMAKSQYFDCVLMDVLMPGIDGYKACREIRRIRTHNNEMPVVMLTSKASPFDKVRGKMAGCNAYLTKPVKIQTLMQTVKTFADAI